MVKNKYSYVYLTPDDELVYMGPELHTRIKTYQDKDSMAVSPTGEVFQYQLRDIQSIIPELSFIKKIEQNNAQGLIQQFQTYICEKFPVAKKPKCRFSIEFKSSLKYDMIADLFLAGRESYLDIIAEPDIELRELKLQYFYEPYGYPLFKLPNSNSKDLWSGYISKAALIELKTNIRPEIEREHSVPRSVIIPQLFTTYLEFIQLKRGSFLKRMFERKDGYGTFHLVTKQENTKLKEFQDAHCLIDPMVSYSKAGIELVYIENADEILYNIPKVNWWISGEARYNHVISQKDVTDNLKDD